MGGAVLWDVKKPEEGGTEKGLVWDGPAGGTELLMTVRVTAGFDFERASGVRRGTRGRGGL